ncbi:ANTAR domain-containing protein [Modestobacter excelsi]|uniref:ANTAR domain-containing protein n=1 Tax=Modestobacter excelsi TaxID=2213161 RepID=UPI00110CCB70|nr:ANTAR domain-containing protein [Modestobacter excelsi]
MASMVDELAGVRAELVVSKDETTRCRAESVVSRGETTVARGDTAAAVMEIEHLRAGLQTSRCIGMAMGILMTRRGLTEAAAFDVLARASQNANRKLRDVADDVVLTGELPG